MVELVLALSALVVGVALLVALVRARDDCVDPIERRLREIEREIGGRWSR